MVDKPIFQICADAVHAAISTRSREPVVETAVRVALQTLIEHTPSPRTVDELTRILAEAPAREIRGGNAPLASHQVLD